MTGSVAGHVRALAEADFTHVADAFANAGFQVRLPARGILQLTSTIHMLRRPRLLLSVGVHGDETAPIELLAGLLDELAKEPHALAVDLMVVVANPEAIAQGRRFLDIDLNRLFGQERDAWHAARETTREAARADTIMRATAGFFAAADAEKWHLDLHTAIRPSRYPTFAIVPAKIPDLRRNALIGWLGCAGIGAVILNSIPSGTYSAYTATGFGAASATVELGQIGTLGSNDLSRFDAARNTLDAFVRTARVPAGELQPDVFRVAQELVKHSDAFRMAFDMDTMNFAAIQPGSVIAEDGATVYRTGQETEYVIFPNPDVQVGMRAGLMVVRC